MKKLKLFFACLLMAVLSIGQVWGAEGDVAYTLTCVQANNSTYASTYNVTINGKDWNAPGNQNFDGYWRIGGGKTSDPTSRVITGKSTIDNIIGKVTINHNGRSNSGVSLPSVSLTVASDADFANVIETVTIENPDVSSAGNIDFEPTGEDWASGSYYKITITYTKSSSGNGGLNVTSIVFYEGATGGTPTCATPMFTPAAGAVLSGTTVTIGCTTEGATIHYTTDGTDPTASSPTYSSAITIDAVKTIKAIAVKDSYNNSSIASASYTVVEPLTTMQAIFDAAGDEQDVYITFNNWIVSGVKNSNAYVTDGTKGFIIYQSSHGFTAGNVLSGTVSCKLLKYKGAAELKGITASMLTVDPTPGVAPVNTLDATGVEALGGVNTGSVIKISGVVSGTSSKYYIEGVQLFNQLYSFSAPTVGKNYECTGVYVLNTDYGNEIMPRSAEDLTEIVDPDKVATPTFDPAAGEYDEAKEVTISCATDDATIYYTIDGTDPTNESSVYSEAIAVSETTTIKAFAVKDGMTDSDIASATYTISAGGGEDPDNTVTFDYVDYKGQGGPSGTGSSYTMSDKPAVTIGNDKFFGNNNYAHFYAGGTITVTPATGVTITQIVLTASGTGYNGYQSDGTIIASTGTLTHEGAVVTWTGSADAAFTLENDKQIRWLTIVVTYETADPSAPTLAVAPTVIDFGDVEQGSTVDAQTVAVNFANLTGEVTYSGLSSPFSATGTISTTGNEISISADASAAVDEYEQTLTVTSVADSKSATVTVKMNIVAAASGDVYNKLTGSIEEGDYVIFYDGKALKNTIASNRFGYEEVTPVNNKISDPDASIIWSISQSGEHWTIYNENVSKYAGATGSNNQGALLSEVGDKALWSIAGTGEFDITNKYQADNSKNAYLRNNGTYGFACYAEGTGGKLILYKAANSKAPAGLAYAATTVEKLVGAEAFTNEITNPNSLTVAYSSNNTDVATVDAASGEVTIVAAGVAEITATTSGDETHKAGSAQYTICVTAHAGTEADPYTVADAKIVIDALGTKEGVYATGIICQVDAIDLTENFYATYWISADGLTTGQKLEAYHGKYLDNANFSSEDEIKTGDEVVIYGNLKKFSSTYEFDGGNYLTSLSRTKVAAGLAYAVESVEKNVGDEAFTNTLTNPYEVTVAYSSSAPSVASVDAASGEVTVHAMGEATITATFAGNGSYLPGSASYTVNVSDPSITKVTFDATEDIAASGELELNKSNVTLEFSKGVMDNGTSYRLYKDAVMTLTCADGLIVRVELEGNDGSYPISNISGSGYSAGVWTGSAESVELEATKGQTRISKVNVYYQADSREVAGLAYAVAAIEKNVGDANFTNALTNPNSVTVAYSSSDASIASVDAETGEVTIVAAGEAIITASFAGNATYKSANVSYTITVSPAVVPPTPSTGTTYRKVTATANITDGEYLIVYEEENVAFNGNLTTLDAANNTVSVVISEGVIAGTAEIDAAVFTIDVANGTLRSHMGDYIGVSTYGNGLKQNASANYPAHTFAIDGDNAVISIYGETWNSGGPGSMILNYNKGVSDKRFRYYKGGSQQPIQLYKKETPEPPTPVYETVRAGLTPNHYYTICYPKAMTDIQGATLWSFIGKDASFAYLVQEDAPFEAGKPYIMYATESTVQAVLEGADAAAGSNNGLHGTLSPMNQDALNAAATAAGHDLYFVSDDLLRRATGYALDGITPLTGNSLPAQRAYVIVDEITGPTSAPGKKVRKMPMQDQTTTGCELINAAEAPAKMMINGQLYILRGEKMYDTTGRLVK